MTERGWAWDTFAEGTLASVCLVCGAVVDNALRTAHQQWHRKVDRHPSPRRAADNEPRTR